MLGFPHRIPFLQQQFSPLRKKDKSKQFLVEQLLPSEDEKQPPSSPLLQLQKTTIPPVRRSFRSVNLETVAASARSEISAQLSVAVGAGNRHCEVSQPFLPWDLILGGVEGCGAVLHMEKKSM